MLNILCQIKSSILSLLRRKTLGARALVIRGEEILLVKHTYAPGWYTIGGAIDKGETPRQAIERELWEEVGVTCDHPPLLFHVYFNPYRKRDDYVVLYVVNSFTQVPVNSSEILEARWFPLNSLPPDTTPSTRLRIEEYLKQQPLKDVW